MLYFFPSVFVFVRGMMACSLPQKWEVCKYIKRCVNCSLGFVVPRCEAFLNCEPYKLTLGSENPDKSLFIIASLQAKWCSPVQLHQPDGSEGWRELEKAVCRWRVFGDESVRSNKVGPFVLVYSCFQSAATPLGWSVVLVFLLILSDINYVLCRWWS